VLDANNVEKRSKKKTTAKKLMPNKKRSNVGKVFVIRPLVNSLENKAQSSRFSSSGLPGTWEGTAFLVALSAHKAESESSWLTKNTSKRSALTEGNKISAWVVEETAAAEIKSTVL